MKIKWHIYVPVNIIAIVFINVEGHGNLMDGEGDEAVAIDMGSCYVTPVLGCHDDEYLQSCTMLIGYV